jgi:hypothetical protein
MFTGAGGFAQVRELNVPSPHQHAPARIIATSEDSKSSNSTNWSGYVVTGASGSVTSVTGSWIIPATTCKKGAAAAYSSFWVGMDGWTSSTVEQTGTDSDCSSGTPAYYAWYEFYPAPSYYAGKLTNLSAGDLMQATVSYASTGEFTTTVEDVTKKLSYTATYTPAKTAAVPARTSAEWIAEAPSGSSGVLPLADFGTVDFGENFTSIANTGFATVSGKTGAIGSFATAAALDMVTESGSSPMATPSALLDANSSFSVKWVGVGP